MTPIDVQLRPAAPEDVAELAALYVATRRAAQPAIPPIPHPVESVPGWIAREIETKQVWVAEGPAGITGFMTMTRTWLDSLYVGPHEQGRGIGTALLELAKAQCPDGFGLWVFASNQPARGFYRRHGLLELEHTDGEDNEENAPDLRMVWPGAEPVTYLRGLIDDVDNQLGALLERRLALTAAVQAHKPVGGQAGRDPDREQQIVDRMAHLAPSMGRDRLARIVHAIITESLDASGDPRTS